jgi:hypothetical protein
MNKAEAMCGIEWLTDYLNASFLTKIKKGIKSEA